MPSINMNTNKSTENEINIEDEFESEIDYEEFRRQRERNDLVSKKLGELLLKGYRMLDETCDQCSCILMQLRNEPKLCVNCKDSATQNHAAAAAVTTTVAAVSASNLPQQTASAIVEEKIEEKKIYSKENKEAISNKLSEYLLKGFKMLNSTCILCDCILMQKRNERPFCVFCEEIDKSKEEPKIKTDLKTTPPPAQHLQSEIFSSIKSHTSQNFAINDTLKTLQEKIEWANNELKNRELNTTNIKFSIELCDLIKSASNAIIALEQLKKQ